MERVRNANGTRSERKWNAFGTRSERVLDAFGTQMERKRSVRLFLSSTVTCIRVVIDYAIPAFYHSLPQYLKSELIRLEKRALSVIIPREDYQTATNKLGIKPLQIQHEHLCEKLFQAAIFDPSQKISK